MTQNTYFQDKITVKVNFKWMQHIEVFCELDVYDTGYQQFGDFTFCFWYLNINAFNNDFEIPFNNILISVLNVYFLPLH